MPSLWNCSSELTQGLSSASYRQMVHVSIGCYSGDCIAGRTNMIVSQETIIPVVVIDVVNNQNMLDAVIVRARA